MNLRFELFTNNPGASVEFYTSVLHFKELKTYLDYYSLQRDNVIIGISTIDGLQKEHYFRPEIIKDRKGLGVEVVLEVDNIEEEYENVKKSGYLIAEELTKQEWGLIDFRIVDPDGYYLRITSRR